VTPLEQLTSLSTAACSKLQLHHPTQTTNAQAMLIAYTAAPNRDISWGCSWCAHMQELLARKPGPGYNQLFAAAMQAWQYNTSSTTPAPNQL
jgi:hypothetical protein